MLNVKLDKHYYRHKKIFITATKEEDFCDDRLLITITSTTVHILFHYHHRELSRYNLEFCNKVIFT
jgi:hypothetical protein